MMNVTKNKCPETELENLVEIQKYGFHWNEKKDYFKVSEISAFIFWCVFNFAAFIQKQSKYWYGNVTLSAVGKYALSMWFKTYNFLHLLLQQFFFRLRGLCEVHT